jgi:hypothetical protein
MPAKIVSGTICWLMQSSPPASALVDYGFGSCTAVSAELGTDLNGVWQLQTALAGQF